jgi:DNA-binding CsgD family transcriptional regulator
MLTPREIEVVKQISEGRSDKQIAARLGCAVRTVVAHGQNIRLKLHALNRAHIVAKAFRAGILSVNLFMALWASMGADLDMRRAPRAQARTTRPFGRSSSRYKWPA